MFNLYEAYEMISNMLAAGEISAEESIVWDAVVTAAYWEGV